MLVSRYLAIGTVLLLVNSAIATPFSSHDLLSMFKRPSEAAAPICPAPITKKDIKAALKVISQRLELISLPKIQKHGEYIVAEPIIFNDAMAFLSCTCDVKRYLAASEVFDRLSEHEESKDPIDIIGSRYVDKELYRLAQAPVYCRVLSHVSKFTLDDRVDSFQANNNFEAILRISAQILHAVAFLHRAGVIPNYPHARNIALDHEKNGQYKATIINIEDSYVIPYQEEITVRLPAGDDIGESVRTRFGVRLYLTLFNNADYFGRMLRKLISKYIPRNSQVPLKHAGHYKEPMNNLITIVNKLLCKQGGNPGRIVPQLLAKSTLLESLEVDLAPATPTL